jgi:hypothetical protein
VRARHLLPLAALLALAAPAAAQAETITYTGAGQKTFVVPAGVNSVRVDAVGGRGGSGACQTTPNGGFGARVSTALRVTPGTPLFVFVAGNGGAGRGDNINAVASLLGGGGAGGASGTSGPCGGGAGGDATSVGLVSNIPAFGIGQTPEWLASRRVVAGGGGGGGGAAQALPGTGGVGGDAGGPAGDGGQGGPSLGAGGGFHTGFGGKAGTAIAGGAGGVGGFAATGAGVLGQGGFGASWPSTETGYGGAGGGGGGGLFGGGGGATPNMQAGAGGGGAGSSFAHPDVTSGTTVATDATGVPSATLTWTGPGGAPAPPGAGTTGGGRTGGTTVQTPNGRVVLNTFIDRRPRTVVRTHNRRTTVSFAFSSNVDGVRFRCKLDQRPSARCSSGKRYTVSRGSHRFRVWAVIDGKSDSTPASFSFQVVRRR